MAAVAVVDVADASGGAFVGIAADAAGDGAGIEEARGTPEEPAAAGHIAFAAVEISVLASHPASAGEGAVVAVVAGAVAAGAGAFPAVAYLAQPYDPLKSLEHPD